MIILDKYREVVVEKLGIEYIQKCLKGSTLGDYLLQRIDWGDWEARTILPKDVTDAHLYRFSTGGILPTIIEQSSEQGSRISRIPNMDNHIIYIIDNYLRTTEGSCIIYDPIFGSEDSWLSEREGVLVFEHEIYHCKNLQTQIATQEFFRNAKEALEYSMILTHEALVTSGEPTRVDRLELQTLADGTDMIFAGAYDGEGFLFCIRKPETFKLVMLGKDK